MTSQSGRSASPQIRWLDKPLLYIRTARHLRLRQLAWQVARHARMLGWTKRRPANLNSKTTERLKVALQELVPEADMVQAEEIVAGRFRFLNHTEFLPTPDWRRRYVSHLWSYNLQYFDFALDLTLAYLATGDRRYLHTFEALVSGWIASTKNRGGDAWEPYPTAVRSLNWMYSYLLLGNALWPPARDSLLRSILDQLSHLERNIEWHLMGNHLLKDLKAFFIGGLLFDGKAGQRLGRIARQHLWPQVAEQFLNDGGHFERAPMYHALAFEDLLEIIHLARAVGVEVPSSAIERARNAAVGTGKFFLRDDCLHLFSDSAQQVAPSLNRLSVLSELVLQRGVELPSGAWSLPETGYYGCRRSGSTVIIDCGEVGASYQPAHGHADTLSYELAISDQPVIVDSGVHGYDGDPYREYVRSTRAHNTLTIDGKDQSEMWATFRVARRARVLYAAQSDEPPMYKFEGAYQPYHDSDASHHRRVISEPARFTVIDIVKGADGKAIESFIHLHPQLSVTGRATEFSIAGHQNSIRVKTFGADETSILASTSTPVQGYYCPEFGKALPQTGLVLRKRRNDGREFGYQIEW